MTKYAVDVGESLITVVSSVGHLSVALREYNRYVRNSWSAWCEGSD